MNSFSRPSKSQHLQCFEKIAGVLFGDESHGYSYNLEALAKFNHPAFPLKSSTEQETYKMLRKCYGKSSNSRSDRDMDEFWKCAEPNLGGFHPSLFNWRMEFPDNKQQLTAKCRNETGLTDLHYEELCSKNFVNDANLPYLLCLGRYAGLNNGQCYFSDRGMVTLMTTFDSGIVKTVVKRCIHLVLHEDTFNFQKYYDCIFTSNLFGGKCFV